MNLKDLLRDVAPTIAGVIGTAVGGPLGPAAALAVKMLGERLLGKPDATEAEVERAVASLPPAEFVRLRELDMQFRDKAEERGLKLVETAATAVNNETKGITERWVADMASGTWLANNIRPIALLWVLGLFTLLTMMAAFEHTIPEGYLAMLKGWGEAIIVAYFGSRGVEKIVGMVQARKEAEAKVI